MSRLIDDRAEWRTFADQEGLDPSRVGQALHPLLSNLDTTIGWERNDGGLSKAVNRAQARISNPDRKLVAAFREIGLKATLVRANADVEYRACEMYKAVVEGKKFKPQSNEVLFSACLFQACRQGGQARTFRDFEALGVSVKQLGSCVKKLQEALKADVPHRGPAPAAPPAAPPLALAAPAALAPPLTLTTPTALVPPLEQATPEVAKLAAKYGIDLRLEFKLRKVAEDIARASKPQDRSMPWDGRAPSTVASAVVFITMTMAEIKRDREQGPQGGAGAGAPRAVKALASEALARVSLVSQVTKPTIRAAYKDLFPYIPDLLPKGWATPEEIARMPNPDGRATAAACPQPQQAAAPTPAPAAPPAAAAWAQHAPQAVGAAALEAVLQLCGYRS
ncbi:hypothetical protein HYH03_017566 [Edaphochlamys debaryana]|uniref:Transcription factor TFIIB cyclin-like domain-containing protein n=1 Tax=Edaphochlamys debaryana TaxID=47281 RepID=A0A835XP00_9CHLO|nr:hypothetical protein HYH03_017566 [Edaphochlamys debaryana]|eukprot:KAG2483559.1 hypothetical protein HYH03_017566 [Edaphochlamys debaryana]